MESQSQLHSGLLRTKLWFLYILVEFKFYEVAIRIREGARLIIFLRIKCGSICGTVGSYCDNSVLF